MCLVMKLVPRGMGAGGWTLRPHGRQRPERDAPMNSRLGLSRRLQYPSLVRAPVRSRQRPQNRRTSRGGQWPPVPAAAQRATNDA